MSRTCHIRSTSPWTYGEALDSLCDWERRLNDDIARRGDLKLHYRVMMAVMADIPEIIVDLEADIISRGTDETKQALEWAKRMMKHDYQ